jgi:3-phosphoshikimate 1-carboxyvinyltransferase
MTRKLVEALPQVGGSFLIEPDASSGSYFIAAQSLVPPFEYLEYSEQFGTEVSTTEFRTVSVVNWPNSGLQIDEAFPRVKQRSIESLDPKTWCDRWMPKELKSQIEIEFSREVSRERDLGDSIMTAIVLAPMAMDPVRFTDLGRLRLQECERVVALRTELTKCGAKVVEEGDTLTVYPSELHGAEIETYNDHRMAMCFAILGLKVPGIKIKNPSCVKKTFPNFFQKLAAPPPHGLGATIRDGRTGRALGVGELFAE